MTTLPPVKTALIAICCALSGLVTLPGSLEAQWTLGASAGMTRTSVRGDLPKKLSYSSGYAPLLGLVVEYSVTPVFALGVRPGWLERGIGIQAEIPDEQEPRDTADLSLSYLSVPVYGKVYSRGRKAYATLGLDLGFLSSATFRERGKDSREAKDSFKSTALSATFGVGGRFRAGPVDWFVEARYVQSIQSVTDSDRAAPEQEFVPARFRTAGLELFGGVLWSPGGRP